MTISVKILADSISTQGNRLTTFQLRYPRIVHSELMTHRVFSRCASSSRAIPIGKIIQSILDDPAEPVEWGSNKPGMQAGVELQGFRRMLTKAAWHGAKRGAILAARVSQWAGAHKQVANRIMEPWSHISVVLTATEFDNWFNLRCHPNADPTLRALADAMLECYSRNTPLELQDGERHLPFIGPEDSTRTPDELIVTSAARCARVSYNNHEGHRSTLTEDKKLYEFLVGDDPIHASPTEHQATPTSDGEFHKNFRGWKQNREFVEA